jgi:Putative zinc-finger
VDRMTPPEEHYRYREQIGAFLLGKLDGVERTALQRHLNSCPVCQAEERELEPVVAALSYAAPDRIDEALWPPEHLEESTLAPILGEMRRARRYGWRFGWSAVAAAAICVVVMGLAGFTWFLEPAVSLELRKDAVRLEISTRGGELVFTAKLPNESRVADSEKQDGPSPGKNLAPADSSKEEPAASDSGSGIPTVGGSAPESGDKGLSPGGEKPRATSPGTPSPETSSPEKASPGSASPGAASPGTASPGAAPEESDSGRGPYRQSPACDQYSCAQQ